MSEPFLSSARLDLYPWSSVDPSNLIDLNSDEEVMRFFPRAASREETLAFIDRNNAHFKEHGYCYFAAVEKSSKEVIGFIGAHVQTYDSPFTPCTDIGWRLRRTSWGKGYATEGAHAVVDHLFKISDLQSLRSMAPNVNLGSIRIMQKLNMKQLGTFEHPALIDDPELRECVCYELTRNQWLNK